MLGGGESRRAFVDGYLCELALPHYGFNSWDAFFMGRFRPGVRPIASPHDHAVLTHACEAAPFGLARVVRARDQF